MARSMRDFDLHPAEPEPTLDMWLGYIFESNFLQLRHEGMYPMGSSSLWRTNQDTYSSIAASEIPWSSRVALR